MIAEMPLRAALNTTEIFEKVLSFLPPFDLFRLQRVCHQWTDLMARSPSIREKMFLRVRARTPETWMLIDPKRLPKLFSKDYTFSDFAGRGFCTASATEVESRNSKISSGVIHHLITPVTLNPLLSYKHHFDFTLTKGACLFWATLESVTNVTQHNTQENSSYRPSMQLR